MIECAGDKGALPEAEPAAVLDLGHGPADEDDISVGRIFQLNGALVRVEACDRHVPVGAVRLRSRLDFHGIGHLIFVDMKGNGDPGVNLRAAFHQILKTEMKMVYARFPADIFCTFFRKNRQIERLHQSVPDVHCGVGNLHVHGIDDAAGPADIQAVSVKGDRDGFIYSLYETKVSRIFIGQDTFDRTGLGKYHQNVLVHWLPEEESVFIFRVGG